MQVYIGIDPGKTGGIAWWDGERMNAIKMPATPGDIRDCLEAIADGCPTAAALEKVGPSRGKERNGAGDKGRQQGVGSAFTFGEGYGVLKGVLTALRIRHELVLPVKWQQEFGLRRREGENDTAKKNRHKDAAQRLFPTDIPRMTHAIADAILIAEWYRRIRIDAR